MPRPKLHRAICDCLDCTILPTSVSAVPFAARQEPPPKCLVIYTDHSWPLGEDETAATVLSGFENVPHLDRLAKAGSCGVIVYREAPPGGNLSLVSQLLHQRPSHDVTAPTQLCDRFNNLQTGFMSTAPQACLLAEEAGMQVIPLLCTSEDQSKPMQKGLSGWPPPDIMAQTIMTVFGFHGDTAHGMNFPQDLTAATNDDDDDDAIDLLFLHVAWDETGGGKGCSTLNLLQLDTSTARLQHSHQAMALRAEITPLPETWITGNAGSSAALHQWLDDVVRSLFQYSPFSTSVLAAILLRNQQTDVVPQSSSQGTVFEAEDFPRVIRPQQSHCISNMQPVPLCFSQSSLVIQHLPGVVRRDNVQTLSSSEFSMHGGGGCILAEHVLPELAYKLGRAAKYGA